MTFVNDIRGFEASLMSRLASPLRSLAEAHEKRRQFNRTMRELQALDDRALMDLGLGRGDIPAVAYEAAYGRRA